MHWGRKWAIHCECHTSDSKLSSGISSRSRTTLARRALCGPVNSVGMSGTGSPLGMSSMMVGLLLLWSMGRCPRKGRRCNRTGSIPADDSE